jgi:hypothetical protein
MRLQSGQARWRVGCAMAVALLLVACVTTDPTVVLGEPPESHTVKVQMYRASDEAVSHYDLDEVQAVLSGVRQTLQERGMNVAFDVQPTIHVDESWEDLYSQDILRLGGRFKSDPNKVLRIFITNKIWSCGSNNFETTVILGCTPVGSPVVVVQGIVDGASDNYGTTDRILWLHEMGHSVQLGHADSWLRVMTPAPQPTSTQLERYEVRQYASLGEQLRAQVVQGAVAAPIRAPQPLRPQAVDVVAEVRKAGLHGLDLGPIKHLNDMQLLPLRLLLRGDETTSTQANALGVLGQLGGVQSVDVVMDYVQQRPASSQRELKEIAIIALAKNQNADVSAKATALVIQATRPSFWCSPDASVSEQKACQRLARIGIGALAQSQQPQALTYLKSLSQPHDPRRPHAMPPRPSGDMMLPARPAPSAIDAQWANESSQVARKFLRKADAKTEEITDWDRAPHQ